MSKVGWTFVLVLVQRIFNVTWDMSVQGSLLVVPLKLDSHEQMSFLVYGYIVIFLESLE